MEESDRQFGSPSNSAAASEPTTNDSAMLSSSAISGGCNVTVTLSPARKMVLHSATVMDSG